MLLRHARPVVALAVLICAPVVGACSTNPTTGRAQLNLLSRSQEIAIGSEAAPELTAEYGGEIADETVRRYVREIGERMAAETEGDFPTLPWEFVVLDSDVINAFALPGGKVFISRGLAQHFENEAQLASVIGHEIGHVTARHANEAISRQMGITLGAIGISIAAQRSDSEAVRVGAPLLIGGAGVFALTFDRRQELEADALGIRYMTAVGYNPIGSLQAMAKLGELAGGSRPPEFLSTHPHSETRVDRIREILEREHPEALDDPAANTYPDRFETQMRSRIRRASGDNDAPPVFAAAYLWCAHCAAAH